MQLTEQLLFSGTYPENITTERINECPLYSYTGPVKVISSEEELARALDELKGEGVLGFDTETRPAFKKGEIYKTAIIQLAAAECVYLFHLRFLPNPKGLFALLADARIVKAGVAVEQDIKELQLVQKFTGRGFAELGRLAEAAGIDSRGLRPLSAIVLGVRVSKGAQTSNWSNKQLSMKQIRYAATDAWVSRRIYLKLKAYIKKHGLRTKKTPERGRDGAGIASRGSGEKINVAAPYIGEDHRP